MKPLSLFIYESQINHYFLFYISLFIPASNTWHFTIYIDSIQEDFIQFPNINLKIYTDTSLRLKIQALGIRSKQSLTLE